MCTWLATMPLGNGPQLAFFLRRDSLSNERLKSSEKPQQNSFEFRLYGTIMTLHVFYDIRVLLLTLNVT